MPRLTALDDVPIEAKGLLDQVGAQFGFVPNMFTTLASNPAVLDVVMTLQATLSRVLDAKTRHTIAIAVSEANGSDYSLAMHSYVSSELGGMSSKDIDLARAGKSTDPKRAAVARFVQQVVDYRGQVSGADLVDVRSAGYTDPQILSIVTVAVQALLTNFINNVNQTEIDLPEVPPIGTTR